MLAHIDGGIRATLPVAHDAPKLGATLLANNAVAVASAMVALRLLILEIAETHDENCWLSYVHTDTTKK